MFEGKTERNIVNICWQFLKLLMVTEMEKCQQYRMNKNCFLNGISRGDQLFSTVLNLCLFILIIERNCKVYISVKRGLVPNSEYAVISVGIGIGMCC